MTTINGNTAYTASILYGLTTGKAGADVASSASAQTSAASSNTTVTAGTSVPSLADTLAAARNSAGYDFATVGANARTVLNAGLATYGQTPGSQTTTQQWTQIFGGMDRRSLFAVASNQGGQFTPQEQQIARQMMNAQLSSAGAVNGDSSAGSSATGLTQQVNFLANVSPEEKQTASWAYSMAGAKTSLNMLDLDSRLPASDTSSSSSLVSVLMGAMYNAQSQSATPLDFGTVDNLSQITSQSWAQTYASQIESAFATTYQPGASLNISA